MANYLKNDPCQVDEDELGETELEPDPPIIVRPVSITSGRSGDLSMIGRTIKIPFVG